MAVTPEQVQKALQGVAAPDGGDLMSRDVVRALAIDGGSVRFVIEVADAADAQNWQPARAAAEAAVAALAGVDTVSAVMTAHGAAKARAKAPPRPAGPPPDLKIGRHPTPQKGPQKVSGVDRIIAIGSGKGGVGKSTVTSNLAVSLARRGRRVGLLDADIHGPSQPRMMGLSGRPSSPDGKTIRPLKAHGVTCMSIGLMVEPEKAVVWRGPMLMGALQQMLTQVEWGELDVLLVDLPPGTGDVQLTLCQKTHVTGAIVVSTPQDVALLDARKALDMFKTLSTPVLGLIENMSVYICPQCGYEEHLFGHGGVMAEAERIGVPFLGALPLELDVRLASDAGKPAALQPGGAADAFDRLAARLIDGGMG
ncbi:MAG: Mrp/NBP35 family ATP-binding protein [Pseudomonadota bacterium]